MLYELSCLINPDLSQEQAEEFIQKLEKIVSDGGKVVKKDPAKKIGLAYAIKKQTNAFLLSIMFESSPGKMEELKKKLDKDAEIIRFLLIKTKIEKERPPRIAAKTASKDAKPAKTKEPAKILDKTTVRGKIEKGEEKEEKSAEKSKKEGATKVEMEKIETELNKILDESQ